jgi:hypothetical protein
LQVIATNKLEPLLGVFQKLIASKLNDHEGFYLIQTIIEFLPPEVTTNYTKSVFTLVRSLFVHHTIICQVRVGIRFMDAYFLGFFLVCHPIT